jgi:cell cycle checkpoint protein
MDVPEMILSQAHGKVRTVADFLYENGKQCIFNQGVLYTKLWVLA